MKALKRKWAEHNIDARTTGNDSVTAVQEPPEIETMREYWAEGTGMQATTLYDCQTELGVVDAALYLPDDGAES